MVAIPDYEQAGELKIGQVGIANLRIRSLDVEKISDEMRERVRSAPKLFQRAAIILDFGGLSDCPDARSVDALVKGLRDAGVLPVGIAYGTSAIEALAQDVGLPLLAKFRASYETATAPAATERAVESVTAAAKSASPSARGKRVGAAAATPATSATSGSDRDAAVAIKATGAGDPGLVQTTPVRSGQQVYAQNRDLTVCATVGAGAEVIADGSIHIYGALRGRALAGAGGLITARIFCRDFNAELVAIAGNYKVLEEVPKHLIGKSVQIWLDNEQLHIEELT